MTDGVFIEKLSRRFPGTERAAVDGLSLSVSAGEVVSLVGPSGCGKSTTLRIVAGLDVADGGSVHIGGRDMRGVPPQDRDVAMVFQGFALYPHMRVRDIMAFPLKMRGVPAGEREKTVAKTAEMLAISRLLDRRPGELSGGEQQRVAMGRAIVRKPAVFLFDEPLSNLDAALRSELRTELGTLLARLGATALYVTHDQVEAMTLSSRIAVMRLGKLEQVATPREIYEKPASTFVAGFFGSPPMNLFEPEKLALTSGHGKNVTAGVRPEHVRLVDSGTAGRVTSVEPLGGETHIEVEVEGAKIRAKLPGFDAPAVGDGVQLGIDPERVHWFDRESERAL
jgi:multiple sugar transport system ATP-binding protein